MNTSPVPRRRVLRNLTLAVALVGGVTPAWNTAALAAEPATFALTIVHVGRDGRPTDDYNTTVTGVSGPGADTSVRPHDASGTTTVRLPRGRYLLDSSLTSGDGAGGTDWIVQPRLDLDHDTTVTVDARTTAPVDVTPPDPSAGFLHGAMVVRVTHGGATRDVNLITATPNLRVAHLGPDAEAGTVKQWYDAYWSGKTTGYALGHIGTGSRALTGLTRHPSAADLATVRIRGAARPGTEQNASVDLQPSDGPTVGVSQFLPTPGTLTYLVTPERGTWDIAYTVPGTPGAASSRYAADRIPVRAGRTTTHTFDNAVFGPALAGRPGVLRDGDGLTVDVPLLTDGDGHIPSTPPFDTASTTLHRDGVLVGKRTGTPGRAAFTVPPGRAAYRITSTVHRKGAPGTATRVTASWTFTSDTTSGPAPVPVSVVRFSPELDLTGTAAADAPLRVPVTVLGAAGGRIRSSVFSYSTDGGTSWTPVPVERGALTIHNPRAGTGVSLRAELTDNGGNTLTQTTIDAYRTR
ncbi:serine protease [Streptomyces sp. NPDC056061]|uniref:serine protease n=1 Tax=Streptomyces sp. NPDC056061 TaxID=3345700 RepID=UPI0035E016EE